MTVKLESAKDTGDLYRELALALEPHIAEVIVAARRYSRAQSEHMSRHLLDETVLKGLPDVGGDALRGVNHLHGTGTVGVSVMPHVRGGLRDESLILFDGVELLEPFHLKDFQGVFSSLDPHIVKSVDIYTGGFPARYGNRMSGVVDVHPADGLPSLEAALILDVFVSGGMARGPIDDGGGDWVLAGRRSNLDVTTRAMNRELGTPSYASAYGRVGWEIDSESHVDIGTLVFGDDLELVDEGDSFDERALAQYRNVYGWAKLYRRWTDDVVSQTLLSFGAIRQARDGFVRRDGLSGERGRTGVVEDRRKFRFLDLKHETVISRGVWSSDFGVGLKLIAGRYDYRANAVRPVLAHVFAMPGTIDRHVQVRPRGWSGHAYGSSRFRPWRRVMIEAGLRWDQQSYGDRAAGQISPRFALRFDLGPGKVAKLAAGAFFQPQGIHELAG